ncbi:MAG: flagellar basal body rod protein FlgB [Acidimicrobiales bacterium]
MIIGGHHTNFLAAALRGLEAQRQAHEHNIANVETPGFRARQVDFESSLRRAVASGDPRLASIQTSRSTEPTRVDASNVQLDDEMTGLEVNGLRQQLVTEALNDHYSRLRATLGR